MRVRMIDKIGGTRNGEPWPEVGESIDVPDGEAADLIAVGYAEEATDEEVVASDPPVEDSDELPVSEGDEPTEPGDDSPPVEDSDEPVRKRRR